MKRGTRAFVTVSFGVLFSLLNTAGVWYGHTRPIGAVTIFGVSLTGFFIGAIVADEVRSKPPEEVKPDGRGRVP